MINSGGSPIKVPIMVLDTEMLSLSGPRYPIQLGFVIRHPDQGKLSQYEFVFPLKDWNVKKSSPDAIIDYMKSRSLDTSFYEEQLKTGSPKFENLLRRVVIESEFAESDGRLEKFRKSLDTLFKHLEDLKKEGGVLVTHTNIDIAVIAEMLNDLHAHSSYRSFTQGIINNYFNEGKSILEGLEFINNRFVSTRGREFINRAHRRYTFKFFKESFDETVKVLEGLVEKGGTVQLVDSSYLATLVNGMAEELGFIRPIGITPSYGTSIENLLSTVSRLGEENVYRRNWNLKLTEAHTAVEDAEQTLRVTEILKEIGKKLSSGKDLDPHDKEFLSALEQTRMTRAYTEVAKDAYRYYQENLDLFKGVKDVERRIAILQDIRDRYVKKFGAPYADFVDTAIEDTAKKFDDRVSLEEFVKSARADAEVRLREIRMPSQEHFIDQNGYLFMPTASTSYQVGAAREAAGSAARAVSQGRSAEAAGKMATKGSMLERMAERVERFWNTKLGKMAFAGVGLWMLLKTITHLQTPDFEQLMMTGDATENDSYYVPRDAYLDPLRIVSQTGTGAVQAKLIAGFGSPMKETLLKAIETLMYIPNKEFVRVARSMVAMPFIQSNKIWHGLRNVAETELSYLMDIPTPLTEYTSIVFEEIPKVKRHNVLPIFGNRWNVMYHWPNTSIAAEDYMHLNVLSDEKILLSMSDSGKVFRDVYLKTAGFYDFKPMPKLDYNPVVYLDNKVDGIHTATHTALNTWRDPVTGRLVGFLSDFSSPAAREPLVRPSYVFVHRLMEGYNAKVKLDYTSADYASIRNFLNQEEYNYTQRQKVMDNVFWYHNPVIDRGVLASRFISPVDRWAMEERYHEFRIASMVYFDENRVTRMKPLDMRETMLNKYNYNARVNVPTRIHNRGSLEVAY